MRVGGCEFGGSSRGTGAESVVRSKIIDPHILPYGKGVSIIGQFSTNAIAKNFILLLSTISVQFSRGNTDELCVAFGPCVLRPPYISGVAHYLSGGSESSNPLSPCTGSQLWWPGPQKNAIQQGLLDRGLAVDLIYRVSDEQFSLECTLNLDPGNVTEMNLLIHECTV